MVCLSLRVRRACNAAAGTLWDRFHDKLALVARPGADSVWLDMRVARKYVKFGETKFRALIKEGTFPQGVDVGGKLMWDRRELDRRMEKLFRKAKRPAKGKRSSNHSGRIVTHQQSARPRKLR
jgi:hypothetical protein